MILLMVGLAGIIIVLIYDAADMLFGVSSSPSKRLMTDEETMAKLVASERDETKPVKALIRPDKVEPVSLRFSAWHNSKVMKEKISKSIEFESKINNESFAWEDLVDETDKFDEDRARYFLEEAIKEQKYESMKDGIERGLNEYANIVAEIEDIKRDPDVLKQMYDGREGSESRRHERLRSERVQEIVEKDLNERLTKIKDIELKAQVGGLGVTKSEVSYNGESIAIYNMQGTPLKMLTSSISYKDSAVDKGGPGIIGGMTMRALEVQPAVWMENAQRMDEYNEAVKQRGLGSSAKRGNTLSCSYTDIHKNPDRRLGTSFDRRNSGAEEPYVVYGWDHIRPGSVMEVGDTDLRTPQVTSEKGYIILPESKLDIWDELEDDTVKNKGAFSKGTYNEVAMKRYGENGEAQAPDYLVIENGKISESIKYHAATFGVPILNVERKYYDKKNNQDD